MKHLLNAGAKVFQTSLLKRSVSSHKRLKSILKGTFVQLLLVGLALSCSLTTWGQQSAVVTESSGNRVFIEVSPIGLRSDLDTLYARIANLGQTMDSLIAVVDAIQNSGSGASVPTVSTSAASDVAETGATLNGSIDSDGGNAITATGFRWGQAANLSDAQDLAGSATSGSFTGSLTGLAAGTTYYFTAFATNGEGTAHGDTLSFTTTAAAPAFNSCGDSYNYQGHNYATVQIGSQCWFAENLQSSSYNDDTTIPTGLDDATWAGTAIGAVAAYNDDESNVATSGRLYNWYAVNTGLLCPTGWHVPLNTEFNALATELGGTSNAGDAMKSSSSDSPAWNGTNTSGFSAVLTGVKQAGGLYDEESTSSYMWASDLHIGGSSQWTVLYTFHGTLVLTLGNKNYGLPVRCLQD
jgi:uncharacterized protein (TIGR02145 family)